MNRPYAESCDDNKQVIFEVIKKEFSDAGKLLEIGSGTGQHALYFAEQLPDIIWHPTEMEGNVAGINLWIEDATHDRIQSPQILDVKNSCWKFNDIDYVFTANTTHIMSWSHVISMFEGVGKILNSKGKFMQYGPFNYQGEFTSESNARFDQWLKSRDPVSGIRNFEDLVALASANGLHLYEDYEMPANNRILVWQKA